MKEEEERAQRGRKVESSEVNDNKDKKSCREVKSDDTANSEGTLNGSQDEGDIVGHSEGMEIPRDIGADWQQDDSYQDDDIISALMGDGEYSDG